MVSMPRGVLTPEQMERKLAALASPETRAKMRAAKLGRHQSPEHIANAAAARTGKPLSPEHRRKVSASQKGRPLRPEHREAVAAAHRTTEARANMSAAQKRVGQTPARAAALAAWNAKPRGPMSAAHREAISRGQVRAYEAGRRKYNAWEQRAAAMLLPLGYVRFPRYGGHAFDFGSADGTTVIEVNGCRFHDHRRLKPSCPTEPLAKAWASDESYRAIARASDLRLIELWGCEEADWPRLIGMPAP